MPHHASFQASPRFAALKNPHSLGYLGGSAGSMMASYIEHVITYWVLWEVFESPALLAFQVISHWLPFLLGSVHAGALADRYDCRRLIQLTQLMSIMVSLGWGVLILSDSLNMTMACVLLSLHGIAGALWAPAEQLILEDMVGKENLESALRLNVTGRHIGILFSPLLGTFLMASFGPGHGMLLNALIYLPLTLFLFLTPYTGHLRQALEPKLRLHLKDAFAVIRESSQHPILMPMILLGGLGSFFIGSSLQTSMPAFAQNFGPHFEASAYKELLFAVGAGGVIGGFLLEYFHFLRTSLFGAFLSTALYGLSITVFAFSSNYFLALGMLFVSGVASMAAMAICQTLVQLEAPREKRGQMIGVYNMAANGFRIGSGFTVGLMAGLLGVPTALGFSAISLLIATAMLALYLKKKKSKLPHAISS